MKKIALLQLFIVFLATAVAGEEIDYSKISEAKSARLNNIVARYIRIYGEPCAFFQTLNPRNGWKITSAKNFCSLNGKSFRTDFSDSHFENVYFSSLGAHLTLSITPLETTGEQKMKCFVPIENSTISEMICEDIENP
ncbi:hypothetical protein SBP02_00440 [Pseudomonas benzenivorans]|uniref:Uncharacterized protein n=1 Tax=Pseudomonas benzenivorans TaxID=556533 RepID=A0ABZ0PVS2_9PSED|nr:hypothetical protein [Pseudomonas benzenivorans]WPC05252.1 hypothetical protein SBP02_00440 [Pseudomonas benzenivorans]